MTHLVEELMTATFDQAPGCKYIVDVNIGVDIYMELDRDVVQKLTLDV